MSSKTHSLGEVVLFQAADGKTRLEVQLDQDTVWLNRSEERSFANGQHGYCASIWSKATPSTSND